MIKDFINPTKQENFLELIPTEDFYTSLKEIEQASVNEDGSEKVLDVVLASVCAQKSGQQFTTKLIEHTSLGRMESFFDVQNTNLKTDSEGNVLNQTGEKLEFWSATIINLTVRDATQSTKANTVKLKGPALIYHKVTENLVKAIPGLPVNLSEEFGREFINSKNMASRCNSLLSLLFGKNRLIDDWKNCDIIFLTPKGTEKIRKAYEELNESMKDSESTPYECATELF